MTHVRERWVDAGGARLRCVDFGGSGPPVLLLHGLAGCALEWEPTAAWLTRDFSVYALDQRGHGESTRGERDFRRSRYVADVVATIEATGIAPAIVVGQSMGGLNAYLAAARHPDHVRALVVAESGITNDPAGPATIAAWLDAWPVPFASRESASRWFGGDTPAARTWAAMLRVAPDGLRPAFVRADMIDSMRDAEDTPSYEDEWRRVRCPTLLVTGERGWVGGDVERMLEVNALAVGVGIPGAGHDVHLDRAEAWRAIASGYLAALA